MNKETAMVTVEQVRTRRDGRTKLMKTKTWCVALGLLLLGGSSANAEILRGVMAINGAEMT